MMKLNLETETIIKEAIQKLSNYEHKKLIFESNKVKGSVT